MDAPFNLLSNDVVHWEEFEVACQSDADCKTWDGNVQYCTLINWDATEDGSQFANGAACYNWDDEVCPSEGDFASVNENYDNTGFSFYTQFTCAGENAKLLIASAIATISVASSLI